MNNLKNLRKEKGYSLRQLNEMTGIPFRTLEDWDNEKRQIQAYHRIKALSAVLECDMDDLMTKAETCLYGANRAVIYLVQEEDGVRITVFTDSDEPTAEHILPREDALELLNWIKKNYDVKEYLNNR